MSATPATTFAPRVELRTLPPGSVRFEAPLDHCVSVHAGAPSRVSCRQSSARYLTTRGDVSVVPVGVYDECFQDDVSEVVDVHLPVALVRSTAEGLGLDPDRAALDARFCMRDPQIEHLVWALEAEHRASTRGNLLYRESLGVALAVHLLGRYRGLPEIRRQAALSKPQLARVKDWIEAHLDGDVSLVRLARVAGVSEPHFRVLFKRATSMPVHAYVVQRRVERARRLLARGELSASPIALEAGFSHQSHMARCMRRVLGVTPAQVAGAARGQD